MTLEFIYLSTILRRPFSKLCQACWVMFIHLQNYTLKKQIILRWITTFSFDNLRQDVNNYGVRLPHTCGVPIVPVKPYWWWRKLETSIDTITQSSIWYFPTSLWFNVQWFGCYIRLYRSYTNISQSEEWASLCMI